MYKIEVANVDDLDQIVQMYDNGTQECIYSKVSYQVDKVYEEFKRFVSDPSSGIYFIVAKKEQEIAGFLCFSYYPEGSAFLPGPSFAVEQVWYVKPEHRGSQCGTQLLEGFETVAKDIGCSYVVTGFLNSNAYTEKAFTRYLETKGYSMCEKKFMKETT
jgi:L-amino acid N-acyltransferase YncA